MKNNAIIIGNLTWIFAAAAAGVPTFFGIVCLISYANSDCGWFSAIWDWALMGGIAGFIAGCWIVYELRPRRKK